MKKHHNLLLYMGFELLGEYERYMVYNRGDMFISSNCYGIVNLFEGKSWLNSHYFYGRVFGNDYDLYKVLKQFNIKRG
jgi:hypothetical protein